MGDFEAMEFEDETPTATAPPPPSPEPSRAVAVTNALAALTDDDKAVLAARLEGEIAEDARQVMARYLRIGANLRLVQKEAIYGQLGYDTFNQWLAQPEFSLSRSTAYALIRVFEVFVEQLQVDPQKLAHLDYSKLYTISQVVTRENVDDFLVKVGTLSRSDLQKEVQLLTGRAGKPLSQAEDDLATLDIIREACPVNCGMRCQYIAEDHDAAILAFRKFLGGWRSLTARIKGLYGQDIGTRKAGAHAAAAPHGGQPYVRQPSDV